MRLINADALEAKIQSMRVTMSGRDIFQQEAKDCVLAHIGTQPTIDAVPVIHAHIIGTGYNLYCSNCEENADIGNDYCPHCGAKMDVEEHSV